MNWTKWAEEFNKTLELLNSLAEAQKKMLEVFGR